MNTLNFMGRSYSLEEPANIVILLLRSCSSSTKPSSLASYCFNDEEKFTEKAGIFRGRDVIGDGNPAGVDHFNELSSIVKKKGSCGVFGLAYIMGFGLKLKI
ncbi:hypothetical protein Tco_0961010 [Tanacetum coccineum]